MRRAILTSVLGLWGAGLCAQQPVQVEELPPRSTPADNETNANPTTAIRGYAYVFDGSAWDRWQGLVNVGTFPDNEPFNLAQLAGAAPAATNPLPVRQTDGSAFIAPALDATLTGRFPAGSTPADNESNTVTITRSGAFAYVFDGATWDRWTGAVSATNLDIRDLTSASDSVTVALPNEGQQTAANSISVTPDTDNDAIGATGAAPPGKVVDIGGRTSGADSTGLLTAITVCTDHVVVNVSTATTTLLVTGVANRHVRICSLNLVTAAANNVALIAGTGATCGTSMTGMNGGTTGATGWNFAANGGLTLGSGIGEVMSTKVSGGATGDSVCIVTSAATQLSGSLAYAIY